MAKTRDCWFLTVLFGTACLLRAATATTPAALRISTETAPAGGWAQIKIYAAKPVAIAGGHLVLILDATVFWNRGFGRPVRRQWRCAGAGHRELAAD